MWCEVLVGGSGSNEKSNGCAEVSEVLISWCSMSIVDDDLM